jgi:DNA-binding CsgD family transcriptional regulator
MIDPVQNIVQNPKLRRGFFLAAVAMQLGCGLVFTLDITSEWGEFTWHTWAEILGVIGLVIGASVTLNQYRHLLRRTLKVERELGAVSGAFQEMIEAHFTAWQLTAAERDVALLSIKGISNTDIAEMRNTRAGTIKAQHAAIYRKAGVSSRAELISVVFENLIAGLDLTAQTDS